MAGDAFGYTNLQALSMGSDGQSVSPIYTYSSETSLGFYRSAASTLALSYGTISLPGAISASSLSVANGLAAASISIGTQGTAIPTISSTSSLVAAFVVQGSASSFTWITWTAVRPGDQILTTIFPNAAASSLSSGLIAHSHCTAAGRFEMRLSNCSTLAQNQSSKSYYFTLIRAF